MKSGVSQAVSLSPSHKLMLVDLAGTYYILLTVVLGLWPVLSHLSQSQGSPLTVNVKSYPHWQ